MRSVLACRLQLVRAKGVETEAKSRSSEGLYRTGALLPPPQHERRQYETANRKSTWRFRSAARGGMRKRSEPESNSKRPIRFCGGQSCAASGSLHHRIHLQHCFTNAPDSKHRWSNRDDDVAE